MLDGALLLVLDANVDIVVQVVHDLEQLFDLLGPFLVCLLRSVGFSGDGFGSFHSELILGLILKL